MRALEQVDGGRRKVLESVTLGLVSISMGSLGGCLGSPSFVVEEFDAAYRTDTGSTWWPYIDVVVKNTGSRKGSVEVRASVAVDGGERYMMTGEVTLEPAQFEQVIAGRPADAVGFEDGSRPRFVAAVWLGDADDAASRETVAGDGP